AGVGNVAEGPKPAAAVQPKKENPYPPGAAAPGSPSPAMREREVNGAGAEVITLSRTSGERAGAQSARGGEGSERPLEPSQSKVAGQDISARRFGVKPLASPAVRRRAWDLGIELQFVPGTGPGGRITQADLDTYLAAGASPAPRTTAFTRRDGVEQVPIIGLRRAIAEHLQQSKRHIPHFSYIEEVDVTALEELRAELNARHESRGHLTLLPFLIRAIVNAIAEHPQVNARF